MDWHFSADPLVDLAVTPIIVQQDILDCKFIPTDFFLRKSELTAYGIAEGQRVLFAGVFIQFEGETKLEPIVREGTLAMIPDEQINTTLGSKGDLYLADIHVFGGNSGSPMFVDADENQPVSIHPYPGERLLGIISGYESENSPLTIQGATAYSAVLNANSGIATVVPCDDLLKILDSPALAGSRK